MASGFDLVGSFEGGLLEGQVLEITLNRLAQVSQTHVSTVLVTNVDLVLVDGDTSDSGSAEDSDVAHRSTHTATNIQAAHALLEAKARGKEVLGTLDGLVEGLVLVARTEMERLSPSILVKVSDDVVEMVNHVGVSLLALVNRDIASDSTSIVTSSLEHTLVVIHHILEVTLGQSMIIITQQIGSTIEAIIVFSLAGVLLLG
mmetsp:Transcript_83623/g.125409  ORF Transcript_83623/g.125409 Transcript_83623/m.125409 type:complete len:202 (-) Transcript_83623:140-745(-)